MYILTLISLFLLGACIGSFLNVCIWRLPQKEEFWPALRSLVSPPSHCPRCGHQLRKFDNVPIFGWFKLRGKCYECRGPISFRYPALELLTACLFALVYWMEVPPDIHQGFGYASIYHPLGPQILPGMESIKIWGLLHLRYAFHMVLIVALIVATFIDFDHMIIPDTVTLPAMTIGLLGNWLIGRVYLVPLWYQDSRPASYLDTWRLFLEDASLHKYIPQFFMNWLSVRGMPLWIKQQPHWHGLLVAVAGLLVGGGVIWAVRIVGQWALKREAMGFGDVVLMAMIGSFIGWQPALVVFFLAPACAIVVGVGFRTLTNQGREMPYGPCLSIATLLVLLGWKQIWPPVEERVLAIGPFLPFFGMLMLAMLGGMLWFMRLFRKLMGWKDPVDEGEWNSADQLAYLAGENDQWKQGQWRTNRDWPGLLSGRGQLQEKRWRDGN